MPVGRESVSLGEFEKGLDSVVGNSVGQEGTMSSGAVHGSSSLLFNGLFPVILKDLRRYLLHEPFCGPAPLSCSSVTNPSASSWHCTMEAAAFSSLE